MMTEEQVRKLIREKKQNIHTCSLLIANNAIDAKRVLDTLPGEEWFA